MVREREEDGMYIGGREGGRNRMEQMGVVEEMGYKPVEGRDWDERGE